MRPNLWLVYIKWSLNNSISKDFHVKFWTAVCTICVWSCLLLTRIGTRVPLPLLCFLPLQRARVATLAGRRPCKGPWTGRRRNQPAMETVSDAITSTKLTWEFCPLLMQHLGFLPSDRWKHHLQQRPHGILHPGQHDDAHWSKIPGRSVSVRHLVVMLLVATNCIIGYSVHTPFGYFNIHEIKHL